MAKTKEVGVRLSVKEKDVAERALKEFGQEGQTALRKIQNAAAPASVSLQALNAATGTVKSGLSGLIGGALAAVASMLTLGAAIAGTKAALDEFGNISDKAKSSGLGAEFFQELAYGAQLGGVGVDDLSSALDTFNKNAGLATVNKGKMVAALKALNPELLANIQAARSQEERVKLAADAIDKEADASRKAALATTLFGNSGTRLVEVFRGGASAMEATAAQARELGIIIDGALIDRAEALGDEFDVATKIMDLQFKAALVSLAPILIETAKLAGSLAGAIGQMVDAMQSLENQTSDRLEGRIRTIGAERLKIENEILQMQGSAKESGMFAGMFAGVDRDAIAQKQNQIAGLSQEEAQIVGILSTRNAANNPPPPPPPPATPSTPNADAKKALRDAEALTKRLQLASEEYAATMSKLDEQLAAGLISQTTYNRAVAEAILKRADAVKSEEDYAASLALVNDARARGIITEKQYTDAVEDMSKRRLQAENTWQSGVQLGLMRIAQDSRQIGDTVADSLVSGVGKFEDAWISAIETGKFEWGDLAKQILLDIARITTQQTITGPISGLLGGIVGNLFGGGGGGLKLGYQAGVGHTGATIGSASVHRNVPAMMFANAPRHHTGTPSLGAGEVPFIGKVGEEIGWPDQLRKKYGGGAGGGQVNVTLHTTNQVNGSGLSSDQLLGVFEANNKSLLSQVVPTVKKAMSGGAL